MADEGRGGPRQLRYVIIGAGMAGILAAIKLKERGETSIVVLEKAGSVGGTWRENRYPGLTCDVPAHAYTFSFAPNPDWSAYYAPGPEIRAYFESLVARYELAPLITFNTEVIDCRFDEARGVWTIKDASGGTWIADVVIAASGVLHHPNIPQIEGRDSFSGRSFHSAQWDDEAKLEGARVGVIGSGSTGVQIVTALADSAARVVHFQRSPQWIMPVSYFVYTDEERAAFRANPKLIDETRYSKDYWAAVHRFTNAIVEIDGPEMAEIEEICRLNLENSVKDPALREMLRPTYRAACKRLIYSWAYYDAVQKQSVSVETGPIERIEPTGMRMRNGKLYELDTIVLATGFRADRFIRPTNVRGQGDVSLDDAWAVRPTAYYAVAVPGFPNFFMLNGPTGPVGNFSLIDIAEAQWAYIDQLVDHLRDGARWIQPKADAHAHYEEARVAAAKRTIFGSGCSSWYLDATGVPSSWPWTYQAFMDAMRKPELGDFEIMR
jgi:cation diffusion facilitator CzcD-associated flavoprotein CzcO